MLCALPPIFLPLCLQSAVIIQLLLKTKLLRCNASVAVFLPQSAVAAPRRPSPKAMAKADLSAFKTVFYVASVEMVLYKKTVAPGRGDHRLREKNRGFRRHSKSKQLSLLPAFSRRHMLFEKS